MFLKAKQFVNTLQAMGKGVLIVIVMHQEPFSRTTDIYNRNPILYPDWIFGLSAVGKDFHALCDFVHTFSGDIIARRRRALVNKLITQIK